MATYLSQISRCLSYHAPICRPHRLLHGSCKQWKKICCNCICWQPPQLVHILPSVPTMIHVHLYTQRPSCNMGMLRKRISFSGAPGDSPEAASATNVVPVGILMPEAKDGKQLKIAIVPMDLANQDVETLRSTLEALNQLRKHANEIDAFTNRMMEDFKKENSKEVTVGDDEPTTERSNLNFFEGYIQSIQGIDAVTSSAAKPTSPIIESQPMVESSPMVEIKEMAEIKEAAETATLANVATDSDVPPNPPIVPYTPSMPVAPIQTPFSPKTTPVTMPPSSTPLGDPKEPRICASTESSLEEPTVGAEPLADEISIEVPDGLAQRLNDMAISSMHLSFEMNMTNVREAILNGADNNKDDISLGEDNLVYLETKVEGDPENAPSNTVPLHFNALIKGSVQIDTAKLNPDHLSEQFLPEYNDTVTSIAASICSTALQRGLGPALMDATTDAIATDSRAPVASAPQASGSKISSNARMAMRRNQALKRMKQTHSSPNMATLAAPSVVEVPDQSPFSKDGCKYPVIKPKKKCPKKCPLIDDPCKEDPCKRPKGPKKKNNKALETREITASKGSCGKKGKGDKKKDPCAKKDGKGGKGGKGKKGDGDKKDPCAKFKKGKDGKGDKKKKDPCAKKDGKAGKVDKKDPCAKFKKGDKDCKEDKKKDPCAKFKKGGKDGKGDKKKDPCAKFKKGGKDGKGDKKKDPCAKFKKGGKDCKGDKKKDPCAKFKKGGDKKKDPCQKKFCTFASPVSKFYHSNASCFHKSHNPQRSMSTALNPVKVKSETLRSTTSLGSYSTSPSAVFAFSTLKRRHYGGMSSATQLIQRGYSKKPKKGGPKIRKHTHERTALRTDCFDSDVEECPKALCTGKCGTVKFPRKKCEPKAKKPKAKKLKKPKKKMPSICYQMKGGIKPKKSKKD